MFLACVILRTAVTPMDFIGGSLNGSLPFFRELHAAAARVDENNELNLTSLISFRAGIIP